MGNKLACRATSWYNRERILLRLSNAVNTAKPLAHLIRRCTMDTVSHHAHEDNTPQKRCTKCRRWKPATHEFFHIHKDCLYGVNSVCRQCKSLRIEPLPEPAPQGYKRCGTCKEVKPLSEFHKNRAHAGGYHSSCKPCHRTSIDAVHRRRIEKNIAQGEKQCLTCEQIKPYSEFAQENGYYRNVCKVCRNTERSLRVPSQIKIPAEKRCPWCKQVKPIKEFGLNSQRRDGHTTYCRDCDNTRAKLTGTKSQRPPLSREQYARMVQEQDGKCAICGTVPTELHGLGIDHDHQTGQIRDLLCHNCNVSFGLLKEDPEIIKSMLAYIEKWKGG